MKELPKQQRIKLASINYKSIGGVLSGIQLVFTNGIWSPMFGTKEVFNKQHKSVKIDISRRVEQVCAFVGHGGQIHRFRLMDDQGEDVVDLVFSEQETGEWMIRDVPEGKEIIGLYCNTQSHRRHIECIGLILWKPKKALQV